MLVLLLVFSKTQLRAGELGSQRRRSDQLDYRVVVAVAVAAATATVAVGVSWLSYCLLVVFLLLLLLFVVCLWPS